MFDILVEIYIANDNFFQILSVNMLQLSESTTKTSCLVKDN